MFMTCFGCATDYVETEHSVKCIELLTETSAQLAADSAACKVRSNL